MSINLQKHKVRLGNALFLKLVEKTRCTVRYSEFFFAVFMIKEYSIYKRVDVYTYLPYNIK